ncbi:Maf family protein [Hyphobacterium marinum]|uniref:dTTP/UTP pyrophosphatase n=1 Tax=Hyphobacterium marinum TaxID=3116574 RepID=A0ABU7M141_9PROT|nr:Maf family nucleotide pyrophosphatase [Hyphobacterium sp. Y6023]MEE2567115.1 Maf family nucleotide pyrophosphatase [Hyphobacterium sp. Y6023]
MTATRPRLVLASASPRRLELLRRIGVEPDAVHPTDIDESEIPGELPRQIALRLACSKADAVDHGDALVLGSDTVVARGRRTLPKAETEAEADACLRLLSGASHRVWTGVALKSPDGTMASRVVETRIKFKRLSETEIAAYLDSGEWQGKAGGYGVQGLAEAFVTSLQGSYSGVMGLPLHETAQMLTGMGYPVFGGRT